MFQGKVSQLQALTKREWEVYYPACQLKVNDVLIQCTLEANRWWLSVFIPPEMKPILFTEVNDEVLIERVRIVIRKIESM